MKRLVLLILTVIIMPGMLQTAVADEAPCRMLPEDEIPAELGGRKLSDEEIAALADADIGTVRDRITTFADYAAWAATLRGTCYGHVTSNDRGRITLDAEFNFNRTGQMTGTGMPASIAEYVLRDDYPGMGIVLVTAACAGSESIAFANAFPTDENGDLCTPLRDIEWHYNYAPAVTLGRGKGCCGAVSALAAFLPDGDYEEVGLIGLSHAKGQGGGHVINYVFDGSQYYLFDLNSRTISGCSDPWALSPCGAATPEGAVRNYTENFNHAEIAYAYTSVNGDAAVGWNGDPQTRLINGFSDRVQVILENPAEGYTVEFADVTPTLRTLIELTRNEW